MIQSMYELGVETTFWGEEEIEADAETAEGLQEIRVAEGLEVMVWML